MTFAAPAAIPRAHAVDAALTVDPPIVIGNPGFVFTISVLISDVTDLKGYDVTMTWNPATLQVLSPVDFDGSTTVFDGMSSLVFARIVSQPSGTIRSAMSLTGAATVDVDSGTGPKPVFTAMFEVLARANSPFHVFTDTECACEGIVADSGGGPAAVPHLAFDGVFFGVPDIKFQAWDVGVAPHMRTRELSQGETSVTLVAKLKLSTKETLAGFGFVVFDVLDPLGGDTPVVSDVKVLLPGDTVIVTAEFSYSANCAISCGTYQVLGTLIRGSDPAAFEVFQTTTGRVFDVVP